MLYRLTLLLLIFLSISCAGKKEEADQNQQVIQGIIDDLNSDNADAALATIDLKLKENPANEEMLYWKAQAYAIKAGIDVYSLFPLMKLKFFDVAISEWGQMMKYSKRDRETVSRVTGNDKKSDTQEKIEQRKKEIKEMDDSEITFEITEPYHTPNRLSSKDPSIPDSKDLFEISYSAYINSPLLLEKFYWYTQLIYEYEPTIDEINERVNKEFPRLVIRQNALQQLNKKMERIAQQKNSQGMVRILFALFDGIDVIKKSPTLNSTKVSYIYDAVTLLEEMSKYLPSKEHRLSKNGMRHTGLLSSLLIINAIKESVDLNKIKEPIDFICHVDTDKLIANYGQLRFGFLHSRSILEDSGFSERNGDNFDNFIKLLENSPEELDENTKIMHKYRINLIKDNNC